MTAARITPEVLVALGLTPPRAALFAGPLAAACERFGIDTPARLAGFIAQCRIETDGFQRLEENLFYTTPERVARVFRSRFDADGDRAISAAELADAARYLRNPSAIANRVYAGRLGNGDEASGDGWRYRGRGIKQLTGRENYAAAEQALGRPYIEQPDLVAQPWDACLTGAWYWSRHDCNRLADAGDWDRITKVVNGPGMLQADVRRRLSVAGVEAFA